MSDRLCLIEWDDACSHHESGWRDIQEVNALTPSAGRSVGWIVKESERFIVLAAHFCEGDADGDICIPRGCITRIVDLVEKHD